MGEESFADRCLETKTQKSGKLGKPSAKNNGRETKKLSRGSRGKVQRGKPETTKPGKAKTRGGCWGKKLAH